MVNWRFLVDADGDGVYELELAATILEADWRVGFTEPYQSLAPPNSARLLLDNRDGAYSGGGLMGCFLRIESDDGTTTRAHFHGVITRLEPQTGAQGRRLALLYAEDVAHFLPRMTVRHTPQAQTRLDALLSELLASAAFPIEAPQGLCFLDGGRLDAVRLGGARARLDVAADGLTFAYIGDRWREGTALATALRHSVESGRGRFFTARDGTLTYRNRHHTLRQGAALAAFSDDMQGLAFEYDDAETASLVRLTLYPRVVGAADTTLWRLDAARQVAAGLTQIRAPYRDALGRPLGGLDVRLQGVAVTRDAGGYQAAGAQVSVTLREVGFTSALIEVDNRSGVALWLQPSLALVGTPIATADPLTVEQRNYGIGRYGERAYEVSAPLLSDMDFAAQVVRFELGRRAQRLGRARVLCIDGRRHTAQALSRTVFDRITLSESHTNHSATYFIIGEAHTLRRGGAVHEAIWTLEPTPTAHYVTLETSRLNGGHVLAY